MLKKRHLIFFILLILLAKSVHAQSKNFIFPEDGGSVVIYECEDLGCLQIRDKWFEQITEGNTISISGDIKDNNLVFEYLTCKRPETFVRDIGYFTGGPYDVPLQQFPSCSPNATVETIINYNEPSTFNVNLKGFSHSIIEPYNFIPSGYEEHYEMETEVKFFVDGNLIGNKTINVSLLGNEASFAYTFTDTNSHSVAITATPTDCQCEAKESFVWENQFAAEPLPKEEVPVPRADISVAEKTKEEKVREIFEIEKLTEEEIVENLRRMAETEKVANVITKFKKKDINGEKVTEAVTTIETDKVLEDTKLYLEIPKCMANHIDEVDFLILEEKTQMEVIV